MTTEQKLKALFQHAKKQGWKGEVPTYDENMGHWYISDGDGGYFVPCILEILLDHAFAKALFGTEPHQVSYEYFPKEWQHRLQKAVLLPTKEEMIDYYYKIVFGE